MLWFTATGLDIPDHKLAILPGKVRLNRIKHLARAINDPVGDGVSIGGLMKENGTSNCKFKNSYHFTLLFINELLKFRIMCSGLSSKGLRLNRIKRLARRINPAVQENLSQNHQSITEGKNVYVYSLVCTISHEIDCSLLKVFALRKPGFIMQSLELLLCNLQFNILRVESNICKKLSFLMAFR